MGMRRKCEDRVEVARVQVNSLPVHRFLFAQQTALFRFMSGEQEEKRLPLSTSLTM